MAYILDGIEIRRPTSLPVSNSTQFAQQRALEGSIGRDYFGDNKRVWQLEYQNTNITDYSLIETIYNTYLSTGMVVSWEITETNYTISAVDVHVDLLSRGFNVRGSSYISDFTLTLTEA